MFNFENYQKIKTNIDHLSKETEIIAISKNHSLEVVENAIFCGLKVFGENRVQEATSKFVDIKRRDTKIKLHLTGPLQSNKVKQALNLFDVFHTLDREKLLRELIKYPEKIKDKSVIKKELQAKKEYDVLATVIEGDKRAKKEWQKKEKLDKAIMTQKKEKQEAKF